VVTSNHQELLLYTPTLHWSIPPTEQLKSPLQFGGGRLPGLKNSRDANCGSTGLSHTNHILFLYLQALRPNALWAQLHCLD
jgi:hypothetical protein